MDLTEANLPLGYSELQYLVNQNAGSGSLNAQ